MKLLFLTFFLFLTLGEGYAQRVPFPNPFGQGPGINTVASFKFDEGRSNMNLGLWTQARVMYNMSNIPGPAGSSFSETKGYDFFRQRIRLGMDMRYADTTLKVQVGAYAQLEYRGGWGGSSPKYNDPRGSIPTLNPYNNLQPRGIRYGYTYARWHNHTTLAMGILPLTDAYGGALFDADWDFNVGGVALGGPFLGKGQYRLGLVRLIEGVGGSEDQVSKNGHIFLAEQNHPLGTMQLGVSIYHLNVPQDLLSGELKETWMGASLSGSAEALAWQTSLILNAGEVDGRNHTGLAATVKLDVPVGKGNFSLLGLVSTGDDQDEVDKAFLTPQFILGTGGYWAKTHIFTPAGPSDVNDFGLEIGNKGAGLKTLQLNYTFPASTSGLLANVYGGWYSAGKKRHNSYYMGTELGGWLEWRIAKHLHWDLGGAYAFMGDFYATDSEAIYEVFSRFQFEW